MSYIFNQIIYEKNCILFRPPPLEQPKSLHETDIMNFQNTYLKIKSMEKISISRYNIIILLVPVLMMAA